MWLPVLAILMGAPWIAVALLVVLCSACAARAAFTGVELVDGGVTVVNFFRTTHLPPGSVRAAGFAPPRLEGFPVPLVLVGDGLALRANGVSIRSRQLRWPDQPFVAGRRILPRVERFFDGSGIVFDPREPMRPMPFAGPRPSPRR
jgi:hypothetical protein